MKVKLRELANSIQPFNELIDTPIPMNVSFRIQRIAKEAQDHTATMYATISQKRAEYTGSEEPNAEIPEDKMEEWDREMGALLDTEVEISGKKIDPVDLGRAPVKPSTLWLLDWMFTE